MKKIFFALFFSVLVLSACTEENSTNIIETEDLESLVSSTIENAEKHDVSKFEEYELQDIIDGDTIRINYNGSSEKVRLLLVDTPETNHETLGEQPYGPEAKTFVKQLLAGQNSVYLEFDVSYRDKYKRLLAYVYTKDGISVQEQLLKNGLARVAYIYEPNTKHVDWFNSIQKTAQNSATGIWSVEDYVTNRGFDKSVFTENNISSENETSGIQESSCEIKGNINSKGVKIYHSPGQKDYDSTQPEEMFCSAEEAESAGYKAASR